VALDYDFAMHLGDGKLPADLEFGAATFVDPDTLIVEAPGAALDALGLALLVHHLDPTGGVHGANVPPHVIGVAGHTQSGLWSG
jgi:hypothetical protein